MGFLKNLFASSAILVALGVSASGSSEAERPLSFVNESGSVYEGSIPGRFGARKPPSAAYATQSPVFAWYKQGGGLFVILRHPVTAGVQQPQIVLRAAVSCGGGRFIKRTGAVEILRHPRAVLIEHPEGDGGFGVAAARLRVRGGSLHAESTDGDMYAAIDLLMDKLDRQVLRHKDRVKTHSRDPLKHQQIQAQQ